MAQLDGIDIKILDLLQNDASQSIADIAERVHLSQNACWRRIRQLEEEGIIAKRVALLDPEKLGVGVTVFVTVRAGEHTERWLETFSAAVRKMRSRGVLPHDGRDRLSSQASGGRYRGKSRLQGADPFRQLMDVIPALQWRN